MLLFIIFYSSVGNAQLSSYTLCDEDMDGIVTFDLTTKIPEALDDLNPDYSENKNYSRRSYREDS